MSETLEGLKAIVDNAPDGATHHSTIERVYYKFECECWMWCHYGSVLFHFVQDDDFVCENIRSLSDIKRIIELMESQKKAWKAYGSLEAVKQKYNGENKLAKSLLKLAYDCGEFSLPSNLRNGIKSFLGDL